MTALDCYRFFCFERHWCNINVSPELRQSGCQVVPKYLNVKLELTAYYRRRCDDKPISIVIVLENQILNELRLSLVPSKLGFEADVEDFVVLSDSGFLSIRSRKVTFTKCRSVSRVEKRDVRTGDECVVGKEVGTRGSARLSASR